jgi:hypothetical protein
MPMTSAMLFPARCTLIKEDEEDGDGKANRTTLQPGDCISFLWDRYRESFLLFFSRTKWRCSRIILTRGNVRLEPYVHHKNGINGCGFSGHIRPREHIGAEMLVDLLASTHGFGIEVVSETEDRQVFRFTAPPPV